MTNPDFGRFEAAVKARAERRHLHTDTERLAYSNDRLFSLVPISNGARALYVGVGHGHDAVLSLLQNHLRTVVGVDPYHSHDGNDDQDLADLRSLIGALDLGDRMTVEKGRVEDYLARNPEPFDVIICPDVLHHIFVTRDLLMESEDKSRAIDFFRTLARAAANDAVLLISDTSRDGLRPRLKAAGMLGGDVDYSTKQPWSQWKKAAEAGGWRLQRFADYIPFGFRKLSPLFANPFGRYTLCDRYFMGFRRADSSAIDS